MTPFTPWKKGMLKMGIDNPGSHGQVHSVYIVLPQYHFSGI